MSNCAIVGINWGDEGKGRMVDLVTADYDVVVRYQGGGNAGHTVVNEFGKFALHLLPSGIFRKGVVNILGNGVALDCESLWTEMSDVMDQGVAITPENLKISDRASLLLPWHRELDALEKIPQKEYGAYQELLARSPSVWKKAKEENNFAAFAPVLDEVISTARRFASLRAKEGQSPYDVLLDDYEEGFPTAVLDPFFREARERIVPLLRRRMEAGLEPAKKRSCPADKQRAWCRWLAGYVGFDFSRGVIGETEHPFTTNLHNHDVRIAIHYYEDDAASAIFSTIHETGHAILFHVLPEVGPVHTVSIIPTGTGAGGYTMPLPEKDEQYITRGRMLQQIMVSLGGRIAEELMFDDITAGASQDIRQATAIARAMVTEYGMSDRIGMINYGNESSEVFIGRDLAHARSYGEEVATKIDEEIKRIIDECYKKAKEIIMEHEEVLHRCSSLLLEKEKIGQAEFEELFDETVENSEKTEQNA